LVTYNYLKHRMNASRIYNLVTARIMSNLISVSIHWKFRSVTWSRTGAKRWRCQRASRASCYTTRDSRFGKWSAYKPTWRKYIHSCPQIHGRQQFFISGVTSDLNSNAFPHKLVQNTSSTLMSESSSTESPTHLYQPARRHNLPDSDFHRHTIKSLKSHFVQQFTKTSKLNQTVPLLAHIMKIQVRTSSRSL